MVHTCNLSSGSSSGFDITQRTFVNVLVAYLSDNNTAWRSTAREEHANCFIIPVRLSLEMSLRKSVLNESSEV